MQDDDGLADSGVALDAVVDQVTSLQWTPLAGSCDVADVNDTPLQIIGAAEWSEMLNECSLNPESYTEFQFTSNDSQAVWLIHIKPWPLAP